MPLFVYYGGININNISLLSTKISLEEVAVSFGPDVETTELLDMLNQTVKRRQDKFIPISLKTESRIRREYNIGCIFAKYVLKMAGHRKKHIKLKPRICVLIAFDLDGEWEYIKNNTLQ